MTTKTKYIIVVVLIGTAFAAGRYSVSQPDVHQTTDTETNNNIDTNTESHKKITIVKEKEPNGKTKTTTTITDDSTTHTEDKSTTDTHTDTTVKPQKIATATLSALAGVDVERGQTVYGASLTKQVIGPVTIGLFGLTNGTVGASIGLSF